MKNKSALAHL